jgi:phage-related protein (TIGR01555 family)
MGKGWGGKRDGSGRKPPAPTTVPVTTPPKPKQPNYRDLLRLVEQSNLEASTRRRTPETSPFRVAVHPPNATPKGHGRMAMDQDPVILSNNQWCTSAWMAGDILAGIAGEGLMFLGFAYLSELAQRPEYRLMSEIISTEATRKWIRFKSTGGNKKTNDKDDDDEGSSGGSNGAEDRDLQGSPDPEQRVQPGPEPKEEDEGSGGNEKQEKIKELVDFLEELKVRHTFTNGTLDDGLFGRGHIFLDPGNVSDDELRTPIGPGRGPLTEGKVGKGFLKGIRTIEPVWTYPQAYNAQHPLQPDWYNPQQWFVMGKEIHATRLLKIASRPVPDMLKPAYSFGGLSLSQMAKPYIDMWLRTSRSVDQLIHSFSVMVLMTDVNTILAPGGGGVAGLLARVAAFNAFRDNQGTFVVNKATEDFKNVAAQLSGLDHLQAQAQEHMAFIGRYPLVKFTGIQPSGLNASSEGEIRTFYDNVSAYQEAVIRPPLQTVIDFAMITLWGKRDPEIVFEFVPLWSMSEKEEGEVRKSDAETDQIRIDSGVVSPEDVRKLVTTDPGSKYNGLDPDDVPDLREEEMGGLTPEGAGSGLEAIMGGGKPPGGAPKPGGAPRPGGGEDIALDADIQNEQGLWAVYVQGMRIAGGFPNHTSAQAWLKHLDRGERGGDNAVLPFVEDAEWEESKHPRDAQGQFGEGGEAAKTLKAAAPALKHFKHMGPKPERWRRGEKLPASPHYHIMASTELHPAHGKNTPNPIALAGHPTATGIALKINPNTKHIHFSELNSHIKGAGKAMVEALLAKYPDYKFSVTDWSHGSAPRMSAVSGRRSKGSIPSSSARMRGTNPTTRADSQAMPGSLDRAAAEAANPRPSRARRRPPAAASLNSN